jgi:hypothetical protein
VFLFGCSAIAIRGSCLTGGELVLQFLLPAFVCTWAQDERPADLHMAQPNVPVSKTGQILAFVHVND